MKKAKIPSLEYLNRSTNRVEEERIYGKIFIHLLYGKHWFTWLFCPPFSRLPFLSKLYGYLQKRPKSKKKIIPFIHTFHVDPSEFLDPVDSFASFNDFFIRKLKPSARPLAPSDAVLPADGRYRVYSNFLHEERFFVKNAKFSIESLLQNKTLAHKYAQGSVVIARLAPVDYHRFHFPCDCIPEEPQLINGHLYSVNPIALHRNIHILTQNKRVITPLKTEHFGTILYIEIGATFVGSIQQTFTPNQPYKKGDEKGYFEFGGSCLILLFEPFRIKFDSDLLQTSHHGLEILGKMGQSLGAALPPA